MKSSPRLDWDCGEVFYGAWLKRLDLPFCAGAPKSPEFAMAFSNYTDAYLDYIGIKREDLPSESYGAQEQFINHHLVQQHGHDGADDFIRGYSSTRMDDIRLLSEVDERLAAKQTIWSALEIETLTDFMREKAEKMSTDDRVSFIASIVEEVQQGITDSKAKADKFGGMHYIENADEVYTAILKDVWIPIAQQSYKDFLALQEPYELRGEAAAFRDKIAGDMHKSIDLLEQGIAANAGISGDASYMGMA